MARRDRLAAQASLQTEIHRLPCKQVPTVPLGIYFPQDGLSRRIVWRAWRPALSVECAAG